MSIITLDENNKHSEIILSNNDYSANVGYTSKFWVSLYKDAAVTVNFGASSFTYTPPSGFSAYGAAVTFDSGNKSVDITLSNGNLTATGNADVEIRQVAGTVVKNTGKLYIEISIDDCPSTKGVMLGIGAVNLTLENSYVGHSALGYGYYSTTGDKYNNSVNTSYGNTFETNDIIMVAMDLDADKIWWGKNGTWQASGDPAAGTNYGFTGMITSLWRSVVATGDRASDKWYWEVKIDSIYNSLNVMVGIGPLGIITTNYPGQDSNTYGYHSDNGYKYNNAVGVAYGSSYTVNDIIMVALDLDNNKIWWGKNGTWQASGDPAAGTNFAYDSLSGNKGPYIGLYATAKITMIFNAPFSYTIPSGFEPLNVLSQGANFFLVM